MKKILLISSIVLLTACATPYPSNNYGRGGYYPNQNLQHPYAPGGNYYNSARNYRSNDNDNRYNNGRGNQNGNGNNGGNGYREGRRDNN